jgi:hypothetical protein
VGNSLCGGGGGKLGATIAPVSTEAGDHGT